MTEEQDKPKIIIDDDWKTQAQQEKQRLSEEVEQKSQTAQAGAAAAQAAAAGPQGQPGPRKLPEASFQTLVSTIATQTMMSLGSMRDPESGQPMVDLDLAKFHIDCLSVLEEKTKGNLSDDEKQLLDQVLYEIRMHYVQIAQQVG